MFTYAYVLLLLKHIIINDFCHVISLQTLFCYLFLEIL